MTHHLKKVELHCHLEGAAPPALTAAMARKYNVDLAPWLGSNGYIWTDFSDFIQCYDHIAAVYRSQDDYALLTETYLAEIAAAGAIYSELIVSPDHGERIGLGADAYVEGVCEGISRAKHETGIETRLIVTGERHFGPDRVAKAALYAATSDNPLITGFNLAGEERMGRVADYARAFDIARDAGLGLTIHAGEVCGAFSVADALEIVRPSRIGHGVRAIEDAGLVERLADLGTVLEVCPGSNIALGVFADYAAHPLRRLVDAGVRVTISSDDPPFFSTSLAHEYELASSTFGFSEEDIGRFTKTGLEAAFVDEATRQKLLAEL